ncbi:hypothetical protein AN958_08722 [Leucoagaricus sp. SymC.cos]|nr:hypothetical protein AN958_08722 [Leucoagaricus sp. SymC.cos]
MVQPRFDLGIEVLIFQGQGFASFDEGGVDDACPWIQGRLSAKVIRECPHKERVKVSSTGEETAMTIASCRDSRAIAREHSM